MSRPPHKQDQLLSRRTQCQGFMLGIQHCPILVESSGTRSVAIPTAHGTGIVWKVLLSNHLHTHREGTVTMTAYSTLTACPRCNCQMQLGCQFKVESTRAGTTVSLKRLHVVRVPISSRLMRHIQPRTGGHYDVCEPLTFYILVKVQIGDTVRGETSYWKVTV